MCQVSSGSKEAVAFGDSQCLPSYFCGKRSLFWTQGLWICGSAFMTSGTAWWSWCPSCRKDSRTLCLRAGSLWHLLSLPNTICKYSHLPPSPGQGRQTSQSPAGSKANWWIWPASGRCKRSFFYFPCYSLIPFIYLLLIEFQSTRLPPGFPQFSPPPIPTQSGLTWAFPFHIYIIVHSIYSATIPLKASFWYPPTHTHRLLSGFLA